MNDIEILEKELANINNLIEYYTFENLDYDKKYRMERFHKAIEHAITALKERQADKDRIKELEETLKCTQKSWFEDTKKIEEYKMLEANIAKANEIIKDGIPKSLVKEKIEKLNKQEKAELKGMKGQDRYAVKQEYQFKRNILQELLGEKQ